MRKRLMPKTIIIFCGIVWLGLSSSVFADDLPEKSIYQFEQEWENQNGKRQSLESLKGKARILAMIYTSCSGACPLIVNTLKRIENKLSPDNLKKTGFVLVSMDPKRDSPKVLKRFAKAHGINKKNWVLLTSDKNNTQEIATALDFNFKEGTNGMFIHQNTIFVLDSKGVLINQYPNLDEAVAGVEKALSQIIG